MHWFIHARRGVLLFTSRFNSPIAAAPHDIRRKFFHKRFTAFHHIGEAKHKPPIQDVEHFCSPLPSIP
jgi:hypothetical protein